MCHEITTPIAIADLEWRNKDRVFDPTKIKAVIDHVTPAKDSKSALQGKIMRDWAARHGIKDFFDVGRNGVCHALFPEKGFIRPGYTVIMGDSHTCTHGAFGAFAAGVGTTDLEVGILKGVCAFRQPKTVRINLAGTIAARCLCERRHSGGHQRTDCQRRDRPGDRIRRSGRGCDVDGGAHDALQYGYRSRRHFGDLPA